MDRPSIGVLARESRAGEWAPHSLELLGDAAVLAKRLGADVVAWVLPPVPSEAALRELGAYGADRVAVLFHPRLERGASETAADALRGAVPGGCRAILLPAGARGEEIAALLAGALGAEWVPDALSLSATRAGAIEVSAVETGGKLSRTVRAAGELPLVITMREGVAEARRLSPAKSPVIVRSRPPLDDLPALTVVRERLPADPATQDIVDSRRIVAGGKGTGGPDGMALVGELTVRLGASLAASRMAVDLGWAPPERQVGQTGRTVRPDLYVACGISGASHHLAGMRDSRHIVAINPDHDAPIHAVAHLSLRGDLHDVLPAIGRALERRKGSRA